MPLARSATVYILISIGLMASRLVSFGFYKNIEALIGYKKMNGSTDSRRPITVEILTCLYKTLPLISISEFECQLFCTAFIVAFFAALRIGELVAPRSGYQSGLQFSDVNCSDVQVKIFIR